VSFYQHWADTVFKDFPPSFQNLLTQTETYLFAIIGPTFLKNIFPTFKIFANNTENYQITNGGPISMLGNSPTHST